MHTFHCQCISFVFPTILCLPVKATLIILFFGHFEALEQDVNTILTHCHLKKLTWATDYPFYAFSRHEATLAFNPSCVSGHLLTFE